MEAPAMVASITFPSVISTLTSVQTLSHHSISTTFGTTRIRTASSAPRSSTTTSGAVKKINGLFSALGGISVLLWGILAL
jgi:hypothetical protein